MKLLKEFWDYMIERENIRLRRLAGADAPYSTDTIFQEYSFTNVKRDNDRTSRLLNTEFYQPHFGDDPGVVLLNCATFRFFGTIETARTLGWADAWTTRRREEMTQLGDAGKLGFTSAYIVTSAGRSEPKHNIVAEVLQEIWDARSSILKEWPSWEKMAEVLTRCYCVGSFMGKEIMLDYFMAIRQEPIDINTWSPVGPGARRGAGRVRDGVKNKLAESIALDVLREIFATRDQYWTHDVDLNLTDIQFAACEFEKYQRTLAGEGRPKRRFRPTVDCITTL